MEPLAGFFIVATALGVMAAAWYWRRRGKTPAPDPRMVLYQQFEAGLMHLIRERYRCTDETAREVRRCFEEWQMDAEGIPVQVAEDGAAILSDDIMQQLDRCALEKGIRPAD